MPGRYQNRRLRDVDISRIEHLEDLQEDALQRGVIAEVARQLTADPAQRAMLQAEVEAWSTTLEDVTQELEQEQYYLRITTDIDEREDEEDAEYNLYIEHDDPKWYRFSLVSSYGDEKTLIDYMVNVQFTSMFGYGKREMYELVKAFMRHGWNPPDFEAAVHRTLVVLHRFKANGTYESASSVFGLSPSSLRQTFNSTLQEWYELFARRILDARNVWEGAIKPHLEAWASAIAGKGAPFF
jgi:hypothetical protein